MYIKTSLFLVTTVTCAKIREPIEMLFGVWTRGVEEPYISYGPGNKHLVLGVHMPDLHAVDHAVDVLNLYARGQQRCGFWLPVYYNNLLVYIA